MPLDFSTDAWNDVSHEFGFSRTVESAGGRDECGTSDLLQVVSVDAAVTEPPGEAISKWDGVRDDLIAE